MAASILLIVLHKLQHIVLSHAASVEPFGSIWRLRTFTLKTWQNNNEMQNKLQKFLKNLQTNFVWQFMKIVDFFTFIILTIFFYMFDDLLIFLKIILFVNLDYSDFLFEPFSIFLGYFKTLLSSYFVYNFSDCISDCTILTVIVYFELFYHDYQIWYFWQFFSSSFLPFGNFGPFWIIKII